MFSPYEYESSKFVFAGVMAILKSIALFTSKALLRLNININFDYMLSNFTVKEKPWRRVRKLLGMERFTLF